MNAPEPVASTPEANKVNVAAKPGNPAVAEEARAVGARNDQAERTRLNQARIDKWIRQRLIDWRDSCWQCRKPIAVGQRWAAVGGDGVIARFHQDCHREWLAQQEATARRALGLNRSEREPPKETP
jgi:hypothetical protein